jgi:hypothetical protein
VGAAAITAVPAHAWQITVDEHGEIRERRAKGVCGELDCGHYTCWVKEAHVTELTPPLREASARDQLADCRPPAARSRSTSPGTTALGYTIPWVIAVPPNWKAITLRRPGM